MEPRNVDQHGRIKGIRNKRVEIIKQRQGDSGLRNSVASG